MGAKKDRELFFWLRYTYLLFSYQESLINKGKKRTTYNMQAPSFAVPGSSQ
jgi:hypothetical protein